MREQLVPLVVAITATVKQELDQLWANGRGWILVFVGLGWLLSFGVRLVFPVLLPYIRADFGIGLQMSGFILSSLWVAYAIGQYPGGIVSDRIGEKRVLLLSTGLSIATLVLIVLAPSLGFLFVGTILFGLASAMYAPARFSLLARVYPDRVGTAIGITSAAGNFGNGILPVVAGLIAVTFSWRYGFAVMVPLFVMTLFGIYIMNVSEHVRESATSNANASSLIFGSLRGILNRSILLVAGVNLMTVFAWQAFTGFYPSYLIDIKGIEPSLASVLFGLFFAVGVVIQPMAGAFGDRFGARPSLIGFTVVIVVGLFVLPFAEGLIPLIFVTILVSSLMAILPIAETFLIDHLPEQSQGSGLGFLRTCYLTGAASGPAIVGALAEAGYFDEAFLFLSAVAFGGLIMCVVLPRD